MEYEIGQIIKFNCHSNGSIMLSAKILDINEFGKTILIQLLDNITNESILNEFWVKY